MGGSGRRRGPDRTLPAPGGVHGIRTRLSVRPDRPGARPTVRPDADPPAVPAALRGAPHGPPAEAWRSSGHHRRPAGLRPRVAVEGEHRVR